MQWGVSSFLIKEQRADPRCSAVSLLSRFHFLYKTAQILTFHGPFQKLGQFLR